MKIFWNTEVMRTDEIRNRSFQEKKLNIHRFYLILEQILSYIVVPTDQFRLNQTLKEAS